MFNKTKVKQMTDTMTKSFKKPKSVPLTKDELKILKSYRKRFETEVDCAISIGIDRLVLNRVMTVGSGAPESIEKIKAAIGDSSKEGVQDKSETL